MKLLILFLFISLLSKAQTFQPGYYPKDTIIQVNGQMWQSVKGVKATASPKTGAYWKLVQSTKVIPVLTFDSSHLKRIEALELWFKNNIIIVAQDTILVDPLKRRATW